MERPPDRFSTTDNRAMIICRGQNVQRAARMPSAQNARSGLAMLAQSRTERRVSRHRTERRTGVLCVEASRAHMCRSGAPSGAVLTPSRIPRSPTFSKRPTSHATATGVPIRADRCVPLARSIVVLSRHSVRVCKSEGRCGRICTSGGLGSGSRLRPIEPGAR
jgi:hypothetical protein